MYGENTVSNVSGEVKEKQLKTTDEIISQLINNWTPFERHEIYLTVGRFLKEENDKEIVRAKDIVNERAQYAELLYNLKW